VRTRALWSIIVLAACLAWCAPAGAADVDGSIQVTDTTATTVSFTVTAQRTCGEGEQCDYYADLEEFDGDGPCPSAYPADGWNSWNGAVLNTGPSTETGTITPRRWLSKAAIGPSRLCLYIFAEGAYYYVGSSAAITRPVPPAGAGGSTAPSSTTPGTTGGSGTSGAPSSTKPGGSATLTCAHYAYQQTAQQALKANPALAAQLDPDGNGVACQGLPKRKTHIRTVAVSAAAASARTALRHAYGRAFTRGTAYRSSCHRLTRTHVRCAVSWRHGGRWSGHVDVTGALRKNKPTLVTRVRVRRP
jgi:hypothetical protein